MNLKELISAQLKATLWADTTLLKTVPDDLLDAYTPSSFSSIRKTYNHMLDANTAWLYRLTDNPSVPGDRSKNFSGTNDAWRELYLSSVQQLIDLLADKDENYFLSHKQYKSFKGELWQQPIFEIMLHVVNHASAHRGQVISMLRNLGFSGAIPSVDFIQWYRSINK